MSDISTNLNTAPYFDDYLENKKFYKVLFKPSTPVQARELSQLQTILQKQISRFGSHVFKDGSIVDGVNPKIVKDSHVIRIRNSFVNNNVVDLEKIYNSSNNLLLTSQSSDVEAKIIFFRDGSQAEAPNTKRLYVVYNNDDDSNVKTSVGNVSVITNSNTVTGTGTSFTNYEVGDYMTLFETPFKRKVSFQAKINNIANNTSLTLNRKISFTNNSISSNNFTIHRNLTTFGVLGTESSPEILNVVERTVRNQQSNTVNTAVTSNTFILDFSVANTETLNVYLNEEQQTDTVDYTANSTAVVMKFNLTDDDRLNFVEALNTTKFSGLQCFKTGSILTSERATVASNEEGIVYHKGQFLNIDPGFVVVSDNIEDANNAIVAIDSNESVVTFKSDSSLLDNSAGFNNEVSPGADRLKLDPLMVSANTSNLVNQNAVAVLINFNEDGNVLQENRDPQYNILGEQLASRKSDTSGSFTVKRFVTDTEAISSNNELIDIIVEQGIGYVNGYRVETLSPLKESIVRGTNTQQREDFELPINFGNYIRVNEFNGSFAPYDRVTFVHNGANAGYFPASNSTFLTSLSGFIPSSANNVGRAYVKSVELESGTAGSRNAVYRIHLFGLEQSANDSISNARTIVTNDTVKGGADIILNSSNNAVISNSEDLSFDTFGEKAVRSYTDSTNTFDNNFVVRKFASVTDTLNANGFVVIDVDDETDLSGNNSIGSYTTSEVNNIILTNVGSEISCNSLGTTTASGNVITLAAGFSANIHVGDIVQIDSGNKTIVTKINSSTEIQTKDVNSDTSGTLKKIIPVGKTIAVDSAMVTTSQTDNTLNIKIPVLNNSNFTGSTSVRASYDFNGRNYKPFTKDIKKNLYRRINTANNSANSIGPWDLGVVDIHKITGIWFIPNENDGSSNNTFTDDFLTESSNKVNGGFFQFNSGQRDHFYDYGSLSLTNKGRYKNLVSSNTTIIVRMDAFTVDNNDGEGYFTVDSYPTTTSTTANTTTIKFEEIPTYISSTDRKISLRDFIDYRPRFNNKENANFITGVANTSIINSTNIKDKDSAKSSGNSKNSFLIFKNDTEFVSDYKINTSKKAEVYITEKANIAVSVSNTINSPAPEVQGAMKVASVDIAPFPSLTRDEASTARNIYSSGKLKDEKTEFDVVPYRNGINQFNIRRYTMKDIGTLDERITNLEYYTSLNALESDTFNKQFKNDNGIERFKNGIFVEPFASHQFGDTLNNEYRASIDQAKKHLRPSFKEILINNFTPVIESGNISVYGPRIMYNYSEVDFIKQDKATKVRPAAPVEIKFDGELHLMPEYDAGTDEINVGRVIVNPDEEVPDVQEGTVTKWGSWRTSTTGRRTSGINGRGTFVTTSRRQTGTQTTTTVVEGEESLGERITNVTATPFIRDLAISFTAHGLRPKQQHSIFFNGVNVDEHVSPGGGVVPLPILQIPSVRDKIKDNLNSSVFTQYMNYVNNRRAELGEPIPSNRPVRSPRAILATSTDLSTNARRFAPKGFPVISNRNGSASGTFFVPKQTFLQGDREFLIADVQDLETESDAILSSASKTFYSNRIGVERSELIKRTFDVQTTTKRVRRGTSSTEFVPTPVRTRPSRDPIAQTFYVRGDATEADGVFVSSIDLFFRRKSSKNPINVYITTQNNGYPNPDEVFTATQVTLNPADVNVSDDASVPTTFTFNYPVFLQKDRGYAFVVKPFAGDPDYDVYFSQLGGTDITTGTSVNSQPYSGVAFLGANEDTWSALQDEDIKFTLRRALFSTGSARVRMVPRNFDRGEFEDFAFVNNRSNVEVGDYVFGMTSANTDPDLTVANVNTSIFGIVSHIDDINNEIRLAPTTGNLTDSSTKVFTETRLNGTTVNTDKYKIAIYRPEDSLLDTETIDINKFVGTSFMSLVDHEYSTIVTQFTTGIFKNSSIDFEHEYNISNTSSISFPVPNEDEYEYTDNPLVLRSRTNEVLKLGSATGNSSFFVNIDLTNKTDKTSPFVDMRRSLVSAVGNLTIPSDDSANNFIDGTSVSSLESASIYSEIFSGLGETNVRYISRTITLADGQDAEDMRVLVSAFKPPRAKIYVFGRFVNQYDNLEDTLFTPLKDLTPEVNSSRNDRSDIKEFEFRMFNRDEINATEWVKVFNDATGADYAFKHTNKYTANSLIATDPTTGIAEYFRGGTTYKTYKQFQLKIVTYASIDSPAGFGNKNSSNPALVENVRAIALQV
jgi:hypothetical protein